MASWKKNWEQTRKRMIGWWEHNDLVVQVGSTWEEDSPWNTESLYGEIEEPAPPLNPYSYYTDPVLRAKRNTYRLARGSYPLETLPIADIMIGPGSLALLMGSEPGLTYETVWYEPWFKDHPNPEELSPLKFIHNQWWDITMALCKEGVKEAAGRYWVGIPDLVENIDILASLRDAQTLMVDMVERPQWVHDSVMEINQVWFQVYDQIYDIVKDAEGGSAWGAFGIWGPGKTAKLQCDACAMFSPRMFRRFVSESLEEQCAFLDYAMFHLDGPECICHLDNLLAIEDLDAIEWTPGAAHPGGADERWHEMYQRILDAGKSVQVVQIEPEEIVPLLDKFGGAGMHILSHCDTPQQLEQLAKDLEPYYQ